MTTSRPHSFLSMQATYSFVGTLRRLNDSTDGFPTGGLLVFQMLYSIEKKYNPDHILLIIW